MGAHEHEDLQQSGYAATDWGKRPKEEGSGKDDHPRNLPAGN